MLYDTQSKSLVLDQFFTRRKVKGLVCQIGSVFDETQNERLVWGQTGQCLMRCKIKGCVWDQCFMNAKSKLTIEIFKFKS